VVHSPFSVDDVDAVSGKEANSNSCFAIVPGFSVQPVKEYKTYVFKTIGVQNGGGLCSFQKCDSCQKFWECLVGF
jgi:hypothetical protein